MSESVQITLITCITVIILYIISCLKIEYKIDGNRKAGVNPSSPTSPRPPIPGLTHHDNSDLEKMRTKCKYPNYPAPQNPTK